MQGLNAFTLNRNISELLWKNPCKKKKVRKNCFDEQEKSWTYFKMFRKKQKKIKSHLSRFRPFKTLNFLRRPTMVVDIFLRPWPPPNYFSAATALQLYTQVWHNVGNFMAQFFYIAWILLQCLQHLLHLLNIKISCSLQIFYSSTSIIGLTFLMKHSLLLKECYQTPPQITIFWVIDLLIAELKTLNWLILVNCY